MNKKEPHDQHEQHDHFRMQMPMGYAESYVKLTKSRAIFISEGVTDRLGAELSSMLLYFDNQDHEAEIDIYIHTNGGATTGMANIYDVMQMVRAPIKTILIGKAYSAGAWILAAGTKGKRYALRSSKVMIHGTQFVFPIPGFDFTNSKNYLEFVNEENDAMLKVMAKHTGQTFEKVKADCQSEKWMDAKAAQEYGIIDHII
jgi:ATP-dependent Clp protease protease subunit